MRATGLHIGATLALAATTITTELRADSMDPALGRMVIDTDCRTGRASDGKGEFYNPASGFRRCRPNDAAFAKLVAQLGFALAPTATHTARTTGFGGYSFGIEAAYTTIDSDAYYWKEGTQGAVDESTGEASVRNIDPDSVLQTYSIKLAKGFPFGIELGAGFGYLANTEIISGGGDVRVAVFEGFRESIPGYFPDVGVGGGVRTITGTSEIKLTVAAFDAQISKPIYLGGVVSVHPHIGYQWIRIFGDAGLVDLTPNTDPVSHCGYTGDNNPATPDPNKSAYDGQPNCLGSSADFNNNVVFDKIRLTRHRINFGARIRYQMVQFGISAITDLMSPAEANKDGETAVEDAVDPSDPSGNTRFVNLNKFEDDPRTPGNDEVTKQWTIALELGAIF